MSNRVLTEYQIIEQSIIKRFRKEIWSNFIKAVKEYHLINENDSIMVCISGGKDSFLLAKCIQELMRHSKVKFDAKYVVMDPGYNPQNRHLIEENAQRLNLPIEIFTSDIFSVVDRVGNNSPCYLCARMRRGFLYSKAKELGCNKIALGHHFNDVIETTLLSMFYGAEVKTMLPKLKSTNFPGLELIRPLYLVKEDSILSWCRYNDLNFINCACKLTEKAYQIDALSSKRLVIKNLIKELKKNNPDIDHNIFTALDNVNINCVIGYKIDGTKYSYLNEYDEPKND